MSRQQLNFARFNWNSKSYLWTSQHTLVFLIIVDVCPTWLREIECCFIVWTWRDFLQKVVMGVVRPYASLDCQSRFICYHDQSPSKVDSFSPVKEGIVFLGNFWRKFIWIGVIWEIRCVTGFAEKNVRIWFITECLFKLYSLKLSNTLNS